MPLRKREFNKQLVDAKALNSVPEASQTLNVTSPATIADKRLDEDFDKLNDAGNAAIARRPEHDNDNSDDCMDGAMSVVPKKLSVGSSTRPTAKCKEYRQTVSSQKGPSPLGDSGLPTKVTTTSTTPFHPSESDLFRMVVAMNKIQKQISQLKQNMEEEKRHRIRFEQSFKHFASKTTDTLTAQGDNKGTILMSSMDPLNIKVDDPHFSQVEIWMAWRSSFFDRYKIIGIEPAEATAVLLFLLPEDVKAKIPNFGVTATPEEVADAVNLAIYGVSDVGLLSWQGILQCANSRFSSGAELLKRLKFWFTLNPALRDNIQVLCQVAMVLLPDRAQLQIREWSEYREDNHAALWIRMNYEIATIATEQEMGSLCREELFPELKNEPQYNPRKRHR